MGSYTIISNQIKTKKAKIMKLYLYTLLANLNLILSHSIGHPHQNCYHMYVVSFSGDLMNNVVYNAAQAFAGAGGAAAGTATVGIGGWAAIAGGTAAAFDAVSSMNDIEHRGPFSNYAWCEHLMHQAERSAGVFCADVGIRDLIRFKQPSWSWTPWTRNQLRDYARDNIAAQTVYTIG